MTMDSQGAQRPGLMTFTQKPHRDSPNCFLGYNATGQKGLEGAHRATETSCVPLLENSEFRLVFIISTGNLPLWDSLAIYLQCIHIVHPRVHPDSLPLQLERMSVWRQHIFKISVHIFYMLMNLLTMSIGGCLLPLLSKRMF